MSASSASSNKPQANDALAPKTKGRRPKAIGGKATHEFTPTNATKFFVPLVIQTASQCLTYPLVGAIVAHGIHGKLEFGAFSQGLMVMFLFGCLGYGLITTGMVFAKDKVSYARFIRVNHIVMGCTIALQCICMLPPISNVLFKTLLGLSGFQFDIARYSMFSAIIAQIGFFIRNIPQVILYNAHQTSRANFATILRIIITALLSPLFLTLGLFGWLWGIIALTLPIFLEIGLMFIFAWPHIKSLPTYTSETREARILRQFLFNIPLSLGGLLLAASSIVLNAVINRTPDGANMQTIHVIAMGIINPISLGALRTQAVAIGFPQCGKHDHRTFYFSLYAGIVLCGVILLLQLPLFSNWYFIDLQNLLPKDLPLAKESLLLAAIIPLLQTIRGHAEGLASYRKRPNAVLAGQAAFLSTLVISLLICFELNVPGYKMGVISLAISMLATGLTVRLGLLLAQFEPPSTPNGIHQ